ncbi:MAG TPA: TIR domain-containing protein [Rhizomicrobium sp.]|nr:TIR domain-containing protein [Rhizomicrobium sp.]
MAGEIFISYRRSDEAWAKLLYSQLRAEGVEAWYDALVGAGEDWRSATARALEESNIFVLLFSENAAQSSDIAKELAAAVLEKKLIVPVRLQNIAPKGAFLYELASRNWVNAYEDTEVKLTELAKGLERLVRTGARDDTVLPFERVQAKPAGIFVAVLPFVNLSSDKEQEFFSDGMTEEITAALAKVSSLKVIARTSAFQFKGQSRDLRAIGQALGADYLVEGSVRKAGEQVRITAQLIKVDDATHVWAENYDRQLTNIFAMQEEIAQAIAGALRVPLGLLSGENLVSNRTRNLEAYQQYLRAKALMHGLFFDDARKILESVVASDPTFAPAWAQLSIAYALLPTFNPVIRRGSIEGARCLVQSQWPRAEMAAKEAIRLDPKLAMGHMALAFTLVQRANYVAADAVYQTALSLDAVDPVVLHVYGMLLAATGHLPEAYRMREELRRVEPFIPIFNSVSATIMRTNGNNEAALPILEAARQPGAVGTLWTNAPLAQAYAAMGRYGEAADTILAIQGSDFVSRQVIEQAAGMLRQAPAKLAAAESAPFLDEWLSWIYLYVGAPERALEGEERRVQVGLIDFFYNVWLPEYAPIRKTDRFNAFMRNTGIVDYWKARGWPDLCHPVGADDFACN